jgi:hypothetical protein
MEMKTSELAGTALDWAVAKCEWYKTGFGSVVPYSTDWAQGGPIIEREWIEVVSWPNESDEDMRWRATQHDLPMPVSMVGPTPLIAAMRCYVASKLGEEIETPFE